MIFLILCYNEKYILLKCFHPFEIIKSEVFDGLTINMSELFE